LYDAILIKENHGGDRRAGVGEAVRKGARTAPPIYRSRWSAGRLGEVDEALDARSWG